MSVVTFHPLGRMCATDVLQERSGPLLHNVFPFSGFSIFLLKDRMCGIKSFVSWSKAFSCSSSGLQRISWWLFALLRKLVVCFASFLFYNSSHLCLFTDIDSEKMTVIYTLILKLLISYLLCFITRLMLIYWYRIYINNSNLHLLNIAIINIIFTFIYALSTDTDSV